MNTVKVHKITEDKQPNGTTNLFLKLKRYSKAHINEGHCYIEYKCYKVRVYFKSVTFYKNELTLNGASTDLNNVKVLKTLIDSFK